MELVFEEIIERVKSHTFHSVKNVPSKSFFRKIGLSLLIEFDQTELRKFLKCKNCLNDKNSHGSMKDSYPIHFFGFDSFIKSKGYNESHFIICSMLILLESIRNVRSNLDTRKKYLNTFFYLLNNYLHQLVYIQIIKTHMSSN